MASSTAGKLTLSFALLCVAQLLTTSLALGPDANCTADCKPCQGLGGVIPYGKTAEDIVVPACKALPKPEKSEIPVPLYPKEYTANVSGSYSSRALARPFDHNYYHLECLYEYSFSKNALHFYNHQHIKDKINNVEGLHINHTLVTIDRILGKELCYCLDYTIDGVQVGPVSYDAFATGATYIGREELAIEYLNKTVKVDHWQKSFYHFWFDVENNVPIRSLNRQDGDFILSVYHNWQTATADGAFDIPAPCLSWWQKIYDKCPKKKAEEDFPTLVVSAGSL